jgi:hypothetical protein
MVLIVPEDVLCERSNYAAEKLKTCFFTRHDGARVERYSSYSFFTSALVGYEWSTSRLGRALHPGKGPPVHIG